MTPQYPAGSGTAARIGQHPIHPMLVPLPIGFLSGALISDIVFANTLNLFWAQASYWLILGGLISGLVASVTGLIDILGVRRARKMKMAWLHGVGNLLALALAAINFYLRKDDISRDVIPTGLMLSIATSAIMLVTGWLGGEMSYRHGIGVSSDVGVPTVKERSN